MKKIIVSDKLYYIILAIITIFLFVLIFVSTNWGIGLSPDSFVYLKNAQNIIDGVSLGSSQHYPPFYSLLLSASARVGGELFITTRWLQIIILLLSIILLGVLLKKSTNRRGEWLLIGIFCIFSAPHLFRIYMMAWSEPLFLLLALPGFYFLAHYINNQRFSMLLLSALFFSMAFLTRYVGIALIITSVLGLLLFSEEKWSGRFKAIGIFTFLSTLPLALWLLWRRAQTGQASPREIAYHPLNVDQLELGIDTLSSWFQLSSTLSWVLFLIFIACYVFLSINSESDSSSLGRSAEILKNLLFLFLPLYVILVVISISFFDAHTPLDSRILAPVYLFFMIAITLGLSNFKSSKRSSRYINIVAVSIVLILCLIQIIQLRSYVSHFTRNGIGYLSRQWVESDTLAFIRSEISANQLIVTNAPKIISIHLKRESKFFPQREDPASKKIKNDYLGKLARLKTELNQKDGVLVYFYAFAYRKYLPSLGEIDKYIGNKVLYRGTDGIILQARD